MKHLSEKAAAAQDFSLRFRLNMQILADVFDRFHIPISFYSEGDSQTLIGIRMFRRDRTLDPAYVYLANAMELPDTTLKDREAAFIVVGRISRERLPEGRPAIVLPEEQDILHVFELMQDTFERYRDWEWKLQQALTSQHPLDDMLLASMEVFHNPMFIHDSHFFILSDPKHVPGMSVWERDRRTGRDIVSTELINDFRTDIEYLNGLKERKTVMYSSNQTGYRILFRNLWIGDSYEGRVLVDEIMDVIQPGDYCVLDYLGSVIEYSIQHRQLRPFNQESDPEAFLIDFLRSGSMEERKAISFLQNLNWKRNDRYICLQIMTEHQDFNLLSANATLGQIETQVSAGQAFFFADSIAVVVNLSYSNETSADVVSKLAITMRESLLKVGISNEIQDFALVPYAYRQAQIALDFGRISGSMRWYYYFNEYMLDYIVDSASREIPLQMLCAEELKKLKEYDEENRTDLCNTLKTYLKHDKNVLRTSKELFVHRSTLSYRLERIGKIINLDLDDPVERMKLMISFFMENEYHRL